MITPTSTQATARTAVEHHLCPICGKFGAFGYGPPGWLRPTRWFCAEHRDAAEAEKLLP